MAGAVKELYLQLPVLDTVYIVRAVRVGVKVDELLMDMRRVLEPSMLLDWHSQSRQQTRRGSRLCRQPFPRAG